MRSVGFGSIRSRWRHGTGGRTLRQLESYKVPLGVAGSFYVRPAAWTKSGEKPIARIQELLRDIPEERAGRGGARGRVNPGARNVVAGVFLSVPEIVSIVSELVSNDSSLGNDTVMYISVKAIT